MPRYCTAIEKRQPCTARAQPGQRFCYDHHPNPTFFQPCQYFNRHGDPCRSLALRGQDHCFTHSPRNRRASHPAIPLIPRTQRRAAPARLVESAVCHRHKQSHPEVH
jgi:hypothetical protein